MKKIIKNMVLFITLLVIIFALVGCNKTQNLKEENYNTVEENNTVGDTKAVEYTAKVVSWKYAEIDGV